MNEPEKTIDQLCKEPPEFFYEKMEKLHKTTISPDLAEYAGETFKRIFSETKKCFDDYLDNDTNGIKPEKLNYFGFEPEELTNIFYDIEPAKFNELFIPNKVEEIFYNIKQFFEKVPEAFGCIEGHLYDNNLGNEIDYKELTYEIKLVNEETKNLYYNVSSLYKVLSDKEKLLEQYYNKVNEIDKDEFKSKLLDYLKNEYGYVELADKLKEEDSFEQISKNLKNQKIDDITTSRDYQNTKKTDEKENFSTTQIGQLIKYENDRSEMENEMENELERFAKYFQPDFKHYTELKNSCEKLLKKIEKYYFEKI